MENQRRDRSDEIPGALALDLQESAEEEKKQRRSRDIEEEKKEE